MSTTTCTYHCSGCGRHFTSLNAFDLHRVGSYSAPVGSDQGRRCEAPIDLLDDNGRMLLEIRDEHGICKVDGFNANGSPRSGDDVTIWGVVVSAKQRAGYERAKAARAPLKASSTAPEGHASR